jgi:preprotein translocase subunit SecE
VNRQTKRLLAKQQRAEDRLKPRPAAAPGAAPGQKKPRTRPRQFLREVRSELKKVAWPSRNEVTTYTVVVLVSVVFITLIIFGLDYGFAKAVLKVFGG